MIICRDVTCSEKATVHMRRIGAFEAERLDQKWEGNFCTLHAQRFIQHMVDSKMLLAGWWIELRTPLPRDEVPNDKTT